MDVHITDLFNSNLILEIYQLYDFNFSDMKTFYLFRLPLFLQSRILLVQAGVGVEGRSHKAVAINNPTKPIFILAEKQEDSK